MKAITEKEPFAKAIAAAGRLISTRSTLPILQNVYIGAENGEIVVRATDLEHTIELLIDAEVQEAGSITIPLRLLSEFLQNNSDQRITITTDDLSIGVKSANHQVKLKGLPAGDYPTTQKVSADFEVAIDGPILNRAISACLFAAANDDTRPILTGLLFVFTKEGLTIVGTDGYRLAKQEISLKAGEGRFIVPKRTLSELQKLLGDAPVTIAAGSSQIQFSIGKVMLMSRLIDGNYPAYQSIIPKEKKIAVSGSASALLNALKVASLFSRDSAYSTKLNVKKDQIEIVATSPQLGESSSTVSVKNEQGNDFTISLNSQYLIDVLNVLGGDFTLEFNTASTPVVARFAKENSYIYLVMPLKSE